MRKFDFATSDQFPELLDFVAATMTRRVGEIHLHHTDLPNRAFYADLAGPRDRKGEAAGREICERIWSSHVERLGWHDIAQHVTIDPAGRIWVGRDWNLPPASVAGHNGNATRGPFMIALVGSFGIGGEQPAEAQLEAVAVVVAELQRKFSLPAAALHFHADLDARCVCPGSVDRKALDKRIAARLKASPPAATAGPLANNQREVCRILSASNDRNGGERGEPVLGDEMPECRPWAAPPAALTSRRPRSASARGGRDGDGEITPEMFRILKGHVLHLRSGRFVDDGPFATTASDAKALVAAIVRWAGGLGTGRTPRVLVWAHGGLNPLETALDYAWRMRSWWLANDIYPVFFVWETGAIETAIQVVEAELGLRDRGLGDLDDLIVERLVHAVGRPFWQQMKTSAENAAMPGPDRGAHVLATLLARQRANGGRKLEIHAAGHSAGAIFHNHFVAAAAGLGVPFESLTFLAPACTVRQFDRLALPHLGGRIARFRTFALDRGHEIADDTVPVYDKSLLYLVSRGFEERRGEPILGLEESIRDDDDLLALYGLDGGAPKATLVLCPTPPGTPDALASAARVHGRFARDRETLAAIRADILGDEIGADPPPPPDFPLDRGGVRLFRSFREAYPFAFAARPAAAAPPSAAPVLATPVVTTLPATGARRALTIAINSYGGGNDLAGCIEDSRLWAGLFSDLGFETESLHDERATRAGMAGRIEAMIRSAQPGDVLALHYSGHGTRFDDLDGDETDDGKDDALVPVDGIAGGEYLIDDDIRLLLDTLHPGVDFTFFADCCHSGTISRFSIGTPVDPGYRTRFIRATPEMVAAYTAARRRAPAPRAVPQGGEETMSHVLFGACSETQTAKESDGSGWFTRVAIQALREATAPISNREFLRQLRAGFDRAGYSEQDQTPQLQGRAAGKDRLVLGGTVGQSARR